MFSAFLLGIVLVNFEPVFGISSSTFYTLALMAIILTIYNAYSMFSNNGNLGFLLKTLSIANYSYCLMTLSFLVFADQKISIWGWSYMVCEIALILILASIEFKASNEINLV